MNGQPASSPDYSILSAFQPVVARPRSSILYQFSLLLVTFTMLLLPLIYLSLVGAAVYGVYYHATHHWSVIMGFANGRGGLAIIVMFLIYIIPVFVGVAMVFFMLKPIFAGQPRHAQPLALNPADNPLLYAFIEKICVTVGAPSPTRIDLDCRLNASVGFRRGLRSMTDKDMVLTIGLPLVANLTAAEFAGVVAHEFGHFTQSVGMRLRYFICSVNNWFVCAVYQRDAWDEALEQWTSAAVDVRISIFFWIAQTGIFFERMVLRVLMYAGLLIAGFMFRQMEYDADACQIKLVGSETFERTHRKLAALRAAMETMSRQIRLDWQRNHQLPDNLSELLRQARESLPAATLQRIEESYGLRRASVFASHPAPADRIRCARKAQDPGAFHDDRPASTLFTSFDHPARFVTMLHYSDDLGIPVTKEMLLRVEPKASAQSQNVRPVALEVNETHSEYFLGVLPLILPLQLSLPMPSSDFEADYTELTQLSSGLRQVTEQLASISEQFQEASTQAVQLQAAVRLLEAHVPIKADEFGLEVASLESAQQRASEAKTSRDVLKHSVREVGAALQRRIQLGLALKLSSFAGGPSDTHSADEVSQAATVIHSAANEYGDKQELVEALAVLDRIIALRDRDGESPPLSRALAAQIEAINHLRPQRNYLPTEKHAHPALHLQLSRKPKHEGLAEVESLRQQTQQWFTDYHVNLNVLVEAAQAGESASV